MSYLPNLPMRILSLDPHYSDIGWAVIDILSLTPLEVIIEATGILSASESLSTCKADIDIIKEHVRHLVMKYSVEQIITIDSSHLIKADRVAAVDLIHSILNEVLKGCDAGYQIRTIPLWGVKNLWTGDKESNRDIMRLAYQTHSFLTGVVPDDQISEREIMAVACGVSWTILTCVNEFKKDLKAKRDHYKDRNNPTMSH